MKVLNVRGKTHGEFAENAAVSQKIKEIIRSHDENLTPMMREALDMIAHKIARILCGNPKHKDHWIDVAGYSTLVEERL